MIEIESETETETESDIDTDSCNENIPIAYVIPTTHVVVNVAEPVEGYEDHVVYSPHRLQDLRNRDTVQKIALLKKALIKAFCLGTVLLILYCLYVFN